MRTTTTTTTTTTTNNFSALGFYETFFSLLPYFETQEDAFNFLNGSFASITGVKPFRSFKKWRKM